MDTFESYLKETGWKNYPKCKKYCEIGKTFFIDNEYLEGIYWYYETDQFIIDIHDLFIKKERTEDSFPNMDSLIFFCSSYIKTANGECFNPYQTLTANTVFVANMNKTNFRFFLHGNFPYLSVGVKFKQEMINKYIPCHLSNQSETVAHMFFDTRNLVTKPMEKLANSILNCHMDSPAGEIFFEAKAKEWLSITLNAYLNKSKRKKISKSDEQSIENVANYINDHFALDISQKLLEKIAMMSGTKLKNIFREKYQMSITEYLQRKRMNIAENLLSTTELEIKNIAKSVGYTSHSRFSTLFKKYKGIHPKEVRKLTSSNKEN
ncbi:AraC family transcriptional regulator [Fusobacterium sp. IOR10]|uniref:helix-turn-helix domain-containing protein n=1 Tax=Fusobacterium sp. IOR10 TaxID=2665157 RepID=UPI0013D2C691|nr:AraC family transcriptional regulator [Fusobacterium sp. IOR10]